MGATFKTARTYGPGQSLFIATPAYEAVRPGYAYCLALTTAELVRHGIPFELGIMEENCHVDDGRNSLVRDFLEGNCTDMLFLDSDLMWNASDVIKILSHNEELVCGAYPKKCSPQRYPIGRILNTRPNGLLEVSYAPTGFMRIQRTVFDKLWPKQSKHGKERPTAVFFERKFNGSTRDGGDVTFCRKWIAEGGKVVVDPSFIFSHMGQNRWTGRFLDYLHDDDNRALHFEESRDPLLGDPVTHNSMGTTQDVPFWIEKIKRGDVSRGLFVALADAYGNKPFAATPDFLETMYKMAINLPIGAKIFECGCGLTSVVLAATGRNVVCLEEVPVWAEKTNDLLVRCGLDSDIYVASLKDGWYAVAESCRGLDLDMLVIDGPRRRDGVNRMWPIENNIAKNGAAIIIDDISDLTVENGIFFRGGTDERPFVAGKVTNKKENFDNEN